MKHTNFHLWYLCSIPSWLSCLLLITGPLGAQENPAPAASAAASPLTAFGRQIPAQRPNLGISIPSFTKGKLHSLIEAAVVTKVDDERLITEQMTIHMFGETEKEHVRVDLPSATYHLSNQILRSAERSKVSRSDFDIEGDSLIFDTQTSQGRMTGNVRMTIYDTSALMSKKEESPTKAPSPLQLKPDPTGGDQQKPTTSPAQP